MHLLQGKGQARQGAAKREWGVRQYLRKPADILLTPEVCVFGECKDVEESGFGLVCLVACCLRLLRWRWGLARREKKDSEKKKDQKLVVTGTPVVEPAEPPTDSTTDGSVMVGGQAIAYRAVAGTLTVGSTDAQDAMLGLDGKLLPDTGEKTPDPEKPEEAPATSRMFYVAYFKKDAPAGRPVTFMYNGGPGRRRCGCTWDRSVRSGW